MVTAMTERLFITEVIGVLRTLSNIYNEYSVKIANGFYLLTIFAKRFFLDICQGFEYASVISYKLLHYREKRTQYLYARKIHPSHNSHFLTLHYSYQH